jgi:predicted dehydrogenase
MRRYEREAVWLREWISASPANFGELRSFDIQSWQNLEGYLHEGGAGLKHWLLDGKRAGGGVVISLAIHQLDLIRYLFGADYVEVRAHGRFDPPFYNDAESSAVAILTMSNGATGLLHANYLAPRVPFCEALSAFGSNGTVIQHVERQGDYRGPFKYATTKGEPTTAWPQQFEGFATVPQDSLLHPNSFVNQTLAFAATVRDGAPSKNSLSDNFNTIAVIEAIGRSIKTGQTIAVEKL